MDVRAPSVSWQAVCKSTAGQTGAVGTKGRPRARGQLRGSRSKGRFLGGLSEVVTNGAVRLFDTCTRLFGRLRVDTTALETGTARASYNPTPRRPLQLAIHNAKVACITDTYTDNVPDGRRQPACSCSAANIFSHITYRRISRVVSCLPLVQYVHRCRKGRGAIG